MADFRKQCVNIRTMFLIGTFLICSLLYIIFNDNGISNVVTERSYQELPKWTSEIYNSTVFNSTALAGTDQHNVSGTTKSRHKLYTIINEDDSAAITRKRLAEAVQKVRLLCVIMTMQKDLASKVTAINSTWVPRCDKHLYIITTEEKRHDFISLDIPDERGNLARKMRKVFTAIYQQYMNQFDYVLKCDDDTYVIVENLKFLLWHYDSNKPSYFGFHFNKFIQNGYMSGGAGYVISNFGIRLLVERGYQHGVCELQKHDDDPENSEDIETGRCLQTVGVPPLSSLDAEGRETFHPYPLERHLGGQLPGFMYSWAQHPVKKGEECCSRYSISYHYVPPHAIYYLDHVLYKTTVFGLNRDDDLNKPVFNSENVMFET